jgi:predicted signal transduction protein with EAL and GGDEF domain
MSIVEAQRTEALQREIERLEALNEELRYELNHDALTGILNRRGMIECVRTWIVEVGLTDITVALLDVDHFKEVNDTLGHAAGDELLACVAKSMSEAAYIYGGIAVRMGGDEFAVVIPRASTSIGRCVVEWVTEAPLSCGTVSGDGFLLTDLLRYSDAALYHSKLVEGPAVTEWTPGMVMPAPTPGRREVRA